MQRKLDAALLVGMVGVMLIMPTQLGPKIGGAHVCLADVLVALLFGVWLLSRLATRTLREAVWPPAPVVGLVVVVMASTVQLTETNQLKEAAKEIAQILLYFVAAYTLFASLIRDASRLRIVTYAFFLGASGVVLYGVWDYLILGYVAPFDVGATFENRHTYGAYLAILLPLAFGLLLEVEQRWQRVWLAILLVLGAASVLYGATIIALVLGFLATGLIRKSPEPDGSSAVAAGRTALAVGMVLLLAIALPPNRSAAVVDFLTFKESGRIEGSYEYVQGAPKQRYIEWLAAINMLEDAPALGVGAGNYQLRIGEFYYGTLPNLDSIEPDSYSVFLVTAASTGFLGLTCLVAIFLHFAAKARRAAHTVYDGALERGLARGAWGAMCAAAVHNMFSSYLVRGVGLVFVFLLALITVLAASNLAGDSSVKDEEAVES